MDGTQFDAWTRRGFGAAAGGLAGSLLAASGIPGVEARGKKKKKRCKKLNDHCQTSGKKKCCCGYECHAGLNEGGLICCRAPGFRASNPLDCCSGKSELGKCICKTIGQFCESDRACCSRSCVASGMSKRCVDPNDPS